MAEISLFAIYCNVIATDLIIAVPFVAVLLLARHWITTRQEPAESTPKVSTNE